MIFVGSGLGVTASAIGLYASYYLNLPSGPAIVLAVLMLFLLTLISKLLNVCADMLVDGFVVGAKLITFKVQNEIDK